MVHETFEIFFILFCNTSRIEAGKQATYNIWEGNKEKNYIEEACEWSGKRKELRNVKIEKN